MSGAKAMHFENDGYLNANDVVVWLYFDSGGKKSFTAAEWYNIDTPRRINARTLLQVSVFFILYDCVRVSVRYFYFMCVCFLFYVHACLVW